MARETETYENAHEACMNHVEFVEHVRENVIVETDRYKTPNMVVTTRVNVSSEEYDGLPKYYQECFTSVFDEDGQVVYPDW